jgi:adenine/guanine phosphoribosyltransferase-like PRPP-binding protein
MSNIEKLSLRFAVVDILWLFRDIYGTKKLVELVPCFKQMGLTNTSSYVSRWVKEKNLPSYEYGLEIIQHLQPHFEGIYSKYLKPHRKDLIQTQHALGNPRFRSLVLWDVNKRLGDKKIDIVLTAESSGISLSTIIAQGRNSYLAILEKEPGGDIEKYFSYKSGGKLWYISHQVRSLLRGQHEDFSQTKKLPNTLIVDDVLRTGHTIEALSEVVPKESLAGIYVLTAAGKEWKKNISALEKYITILYNPE